MSHESPAGLLNNAWLFDKQREAYRDSLPLVMRLAEPLLGQKISSEAEMDQFIDQNYGAVPWLNELDARWRATANTWRLPDRNYAVAGQRRPFFYGGVPAYFLLAAAGLIAVMLRRGRTPGGESAQSDGARLRAFHVAWGLTMLGFFFVIMLTGNVRPRFRFVFEPFWFLYAGLLLETIWLAVAGMFSPKTGDPR